MVVVAVEVGVEGMVAVEVGVVVVVAVGVGVEVEGMVGVVVEGMVGVVVVVGVAVEGMVGVAVIEDAGSYANDHGLCECGRRARLGSAWCSRCLGRDDRVYDVPPAAPAEEGVVKIGAAFPSQYLKADDLGTARPVVTIARVELEEIGGEHKPVIYFQGKERGLVLNKTNANAIVGMTGTDETDQWKGVRVCLYRTMVDFQGKRVPAIRIEDAPNGRPAPAPAAPMASVPDDEVPF